jgi:hypothetical protein
LELNVIEVCVKAMSIKFSIMSSNKKYLSIIFTSIFLLAVVLTQTSSSAESQAGKQNVLRRASLEWMQLGFRQYQSNQFEDAEQSFRRALVFKKYLTEAELLKINDYLAKARSGSSEGIQPAENIQPAKAEEKVEDGETLAVKQQQQTAKEPKTISSLIEQKDQSVTPAAPDVSENQSEAESPAEVIVVKDKSFMSELMLLSDWLSENRRNVLMIGLPVLAVLLIIMKLQRRIKPIRRIYANYAPASSSFIGAKLNGDRKTGRPASTVANPKWKSFEQSTEHWKKNAVKSPAERKPVETKEKWPPQKDKPAAGDVAVAKVEKKQCGKCKQFKPHSEFYKNKSTKDGLARWCKQCKKEYRRKRAAEKK